MANKVVLTGTVSQTPECKIVGAKGNKLAVIRLNVAEQRWDAQSQSMMDTTVEIEATAWNRKGNLLADKAEVIRVGTPILIDGKIKIESWKDQKTGMPRSKVGIGVENIEVIGDNNVASIQGQRQTKTPVQQQEEDHF